MQILLYIRRRKEGEIYESILARYALQANGING